MKVAKRYDFIDYAKAIAITLMVIYHTSASYPILGSFRMSTFLFIGGMFAKGNKVSFGEITIKGISQLLIPYFILSLISFAICWVSPRLHPELYYGAHSFLEIFKRAFIGMLLMQDKVTPYSFMPCGPLWFLPALFWCRIFFWFWAHNFRTPLIFTRLLLISVLILIYFYKITIFSLSPAAISFPLFLSGFYLKNFVLNTLTKLKTPSIILFGSIILALIYFSDGHFIGFGGGSITGLPPIAYLRSFLGTLFIIFIVIFLDSIPVRKFKNILSGVGSGTIAILGLHGIGIYLFKFGYNLLGYSPSDIPFLLAIPVSILIVLVCITIHKKILIKYLPSSVGKGNLKWLSTLSTHFYKQKINSNK